MVQKATLVKNHVNWFFSHLSPNRKFATTFTKCHHFPFFIFYLFSSHDEKYQQKRASTFCPLWGSGTKSLIVHLQMAETQFHQLRDDNMSTMCQGSDLWFGFFNYEDYWRFWPTLGLRQDVQVCQGQDLPWPEIFHNSSSPNHQEQAVPTKSYPTKSYQPTKTSGPINHQEHEKNWAQWALNSPINQQEQAALSFNQPEQVVLSTNKNR